MSDPLSKTKSWLTAQLLEKKQPIGIARKNGTVIGKEFAAFIPLSAFHDFLISLDADIPSVLEFCKDKGWLEETVLRDRFFGNTRVYTVTDAVMQSYEAPAAHHVSTLPRIDKQSRSWKLLAAMRELGALDSNTRKTQAAIVQGAELGANPDSWKSVFGVLKRLELTDSLGRGRHGGNWITPRGLKTLEG